MPSSSASSATAAHPPAYTWLRLVEALDGLQKARVEARHVEATALTALEHEAFGRFHDERCKIPTLLPVEGLKERRLTLTYSLSHTHLTP